eukprot:scaffold3084_cov144-Cylindrotheca_fusiformis.AAC.64
MVPISEKPVSTVPEARLRSDKTSTDFEKQSRSASSPRFSFPGVDWGAGVSAVAHSPTSAKGRKLASGERRSLRLRKQEGTEVRKERKEKIRGRKKRLEVNIDERKEVEKEQENRVDATGPRRRHSETRPAPRRTPSKRDKRSRRQRCTSRSNSPGESRRRGLAAASSTTLEISRKESQRSSATRRSVRRGGSTEHEHLPGVDSSLKMLAIRCKITEDVGQLVDRVKWFHAQCEDYQGPSLVFIATFILLTTIVFQADTHHKASGASLARAEDKQKECFAP